MPTYEYACTECKRHFEIYQSFSEAPLETCEVCGGKLRRVFHPVGIVLKGSGFYSTDNRGGKKFTPAKETKDSTSDTSTGTGVASSSSESSGSESSSAKTAKKKTDAGGKTT